MTTILVILYCVIAFLVDHATMRSWKENKDKSLLLGTAPQDILDNYTMFRFGVFLGAAFWPITTIFTIINIWRK